MNRAQTSGLPGHQHRRRPGRGSGGRRQCRRRHQRSHAHQPRAHRRRRAGPRGAHRRRLALARHRRGGRPVPGRPRVPGRRRGARDAAQRRIRRQHRHPRRAQPGAGSWRSCLDEQAGDGLLESYDAERRPASRFTAEQAFTRYVTRSAPWLQVDPPLAPLAPDFDIEIGYVYESSAVASEPGGPTGHTDPRTSCGVPGTRLPHVWVERHGQRRSTLDLTGSFLLLAGPQGAAWCEAARGIPAPAITAYRISGRCERRERQPDRGTRDRG